MFGKLAPAPREKAEMIRIRSRNVPIRRCCELLNVSRALVYHEPAKPAAHPFKDEIERTCGASPAYGYRRVAASLRKQGVSITEKQARLQMRKMGLLRPKKRRKAHTTFSVPIEAMNLAKSSRPNNPNELWVADITYVPFGKRGYAYLAAIVDAFSRKVVGHSISRSLHSDLCIDALQKAVSSRRPAQGWIHHSDRGSQYASKAYRDLVASSGGLLSFSGVGKPRDNAIAESFFKTLKTEEVFWAEYETFEDAEKGLGAFIDEVYNQNRLHSSLGYESPVEFERRMAERNLIECV